MVGKGDMAPTGVDVRDRIGVGIGIGVRVL